jgi:prepilin-type N-terminal cleavage/methylation domain-containing protein
MLRAFRSPTVPALDSRETNVRWPARRLLKEWIAWADPSPVTRGFGRRIRALSGSEKGFTLIEVLVSALVVTLIAAAVAEALVTNVKVTADQHRRTEAQMLAEQDQERLKGLSAEQLDNLSQTYNATYDGYNFQVSSQAWYLSSTNGAACSSGGGAGVTYFKTISTVSWTNAAGAAQTLATDESVITPPAGGSLLAQFHDQTTAPLAGVTVTATGPESDTATSDGNGCTIMTGLQTGSYNLTYTDNGYVDPNGNASPIADTANVASTGMATPSRGNPIELGQAGGISATFGVANTSLTFAADALSWYGSGGGYSMSNARTHQPSSPATSIYTTTVSGTGPGGLFPFASLNPTSYTNNYQLWAGTCRQEEPPAGTDAASVTPGYTSATPMPVTAPAIDVNAAYTNQVGSVTAVAPSDVKVTFNSASGNSCTDTWGPFTASSTNQGTGTPVNYVYPAPFASSATSGSTASASGQTGTITVCADYTPGGGKYYKASSGTYTDTYASTTPISTIAIKYASTPSGKC